MPPPITGVASGQHMDLSHLVAWDFNLTPAIFPSNGINLGSTLQTTPATNPSGQSWGIIDATGSTGHPLSWSEASPLTTVASSDYFASTAETSITSASDNSHDIDMSDVHGLSLGTARSQPASGLREAPSPLPYNRTGENTDRDRAHSDLLAPPSSSILGTKDLEKSGAAEDSLPSTYVTLELLDIFFVRYHSFLPCIHQKTLLDRVKQGGASIASNPLIWSILAVAAPGHSDHGVQVLQKKWLARARFLFDRNVCHTMLPTQSLQAAVWVGFQAWISANLTEAWFIVGKACQLANVLRLDQMDSPRSKQLISMTPRPRNAIEVEEQRKAMWSLLCMERSLACLGGFTLSVDERYFQVNYPIDDEAFQVMKSTDQTAPIPSEPFTADLNSLLNPAIIQKLGPRPSITHVLRAYVLLGRIMSLHNNLHRSRENGEFKTELTQLEVIAGLFEFTISRFAAEETSLADPKEVWLQLWLQALVQTCMILLYHPAASSQSPNTSQPIYSEQNRDVTDPNFQRCLDAARRFLAATQRMVDKPASVLMNPFLVKAIFLCGRLISIAWHEGQKQSDRDDIDFLLLLVDRVGEVWEPLAMKYRKGILRDLRIDVDRARQLRVGTGCYLSAECA